MKSIKIILTVLFCISICSCSEDNVNHEAEELPLVVEGWIEDGEHPVVIVTRAVNLSQDLSEINDIVEKWCRVSIDDGTGPVILSGRVNNNFVPSFIYTTNKITGKTGNEYHLKIETEEHTYSAKTKIPPSVRLDSVQVRRTERCDTLYSVSAFADIQNSEQQFFKFFSRVRGHESRYYSSFLGTFEKAKYNAVTGMNVAKGIHQTYTGTFSPWYCSGDEVDIKLCTLTPEGFEFWNAYENYVSLSGNMFMTVSKGCPSNIDGARGYWLGYGVSYFSVKVGE